MVRFPSAPLLGAAVLGALALLPSAASANWTSPYTLATAGSSGGYQQVNNYSCSGGTGSVFGRGWDGNGNYYVQWADSQMPALALPGGATLVGALVTGAVHEVNGYGGIPPSGNYSVGFGAGTGSASNAGNTPGCRNIGSWGGDAAGVHLPGNTWQDVPFAIHAYHAVLAYVTGGVPSYLGRPVYMSSFGSTESWVEESGPMSLEMQYAFQPTLNVQPVDAGNGTQVTIGVNADGNGNDIADTITRETLKAAGAVMYANPTAGSALTWSNGAISADPALTCTGFCSAPGPGYTLKYRVSIYSCGDEVGGAAEPASSSVATSAWSGSPGATLRGLSTGCFNVYGSSAWFFGNSAWPSYYSGTGYGGWVSPWQTLASGSVTSFTTSDQACGVGYLYSIRAAGQDAATAWWTSPEWDEHPCSLSISVPFGVTDHIDIAWPEVTPTAAYDLVWCQSNQCAQQWWNVGGATSARLTGLTPNTDYTVWVCSTTDAWSCPVASAWTYAATPSLALNNDGTGVPYDGQAMTWSANNNPPGTLYQVRQARYTPAGSASYDSPYTGSGTSTTVPQASGGSYTYWAFAENAGYGNSLTAASNGVTTQVASAPTLTITGPTTATVSWPAVAGMSQAGVVCQEPAGGAWTTVGTATGGATAFSLSGLTPNTRYYCATYAEASNQGIQWWQGTNVAYTFANPPTALQVRDASSPWAPPQVDLSWSGNGNPSGTTYSVSEQAVSPGGTVLATRAECLGTTATSCRTVDMGWGQVYDLSVRAINGDGIGTSGAAPIAWATAPSPDAVAPSSNRVAVSWPDVGSGSHYTVYWSAAGGPCCQNSGDLPVGTTSYTITGLSPGSAYNVMLMADVPETGGDWCGGGSCWWSNGVAVSTAPAAPTAVGLTGIRQTALTATWGTAGNGPGVRYQAVLETAPSGGSWLQHSGWITGTAWTFTGLTPGSDYEVWVQAVSGAGQTSAWTLVGQAYTVPAAPADFTATSGGFGWSPTAGRGYVTLSWSPSPGATGYEVWVWDGAAYELFDVGSTTHWDSRAAKIYPPDTALYPNVSQGSGSTPIFSHDGGGLDLRDRPLNLYCTTGTADCSQSPADNYWFGVSAYNASGNSATAAPGYACGQSGECATPTLPLQTDPAAPTVAAWELNGGGAYTYGRVVPFSLDAAESPAGVAAYALSNDGATWTTTGVSGCTVGQAAPCGGSLQATGTWTLTPGPGTKTVWAKVESTAGVWSAPATASVYVNVDQTVPTVNVVLDGGAVSTPSTSVTVAVRVSDPVADQTGLTWQARYSTDGGQTWSAWQSEGGARTWSTPWTIPGGASGERTVLVQAENSDRNLGQGGAAIAYAASVGSGSGSATAAGRPCRWTVGGIMVTATCVTSSQVSVPLTPPTGAVRMRTSLDNVDWGPWLSVATELPMDLGAAAGAKTVWVEYQDGQGAVSPQSPLYYVYDPGAPTVLVGWLGDASATDTSADATLELQATDPVGTVGMTVAVTENGAQLYSGSYANAIPLTLAGAGYQYVQVTVTNVAGGTTTLQAGIYVQ